MPAPSILLVDDDADVRALLGAFLTEEGFVVHMARNGRHALQVLDKIAPPAVILLDYKMPVMNGNQFLAAKRRIPRIQDVPVIVLSAWTREWIGARLDAIEVLSKPVELERLRNIVRALCGKSPSRVEPAGAADQTETATPPSG